MRAAKQFRQIAVPLIVGATAIAAIDVARRVFRHAQLFAPSPEPAKSWDPADYGIPREAVEEHLFETSDGEMLYSWYCRSPRPVASAVYCHGNKGNLTSTAQIIPRLLDSGINVLVFDYRGFGRSEGTPSINGVVSDGVAAARFHERVRPKALPSILYGYSLGGAVAAQVIKRHPFDALILQSTFTTLPQITRSLFPHLPLHFLVGKRFDTVSVMRHLTIPLLVIHGAADEVIPASMAHDLYDACNSPKQIEILEGGLHKDVYLRDCDALVWAINRFAASLTPGKRSIALGPPVESHALLDATLRGLRRLLRRRAVIPQVL